MAAPKTLRKMPAEKRSHIEADITEGRRLRKEADKYSAAELADKFELWFEGETRKQAAKRIHNMLNGDYLCEDLRLISECWEKRQSIKEQAADYSQNAIAERHSISKHTVKSIENGMRRR